MKMLGLEIYITIGSKTLGYVYLHVAQYYWVINVTGSDMEKKMENVTLLITEIISSIFLLFICVVIFYVSVRWTRLFLSWNTDMQ